MFTSATSNPASARSIWIPVSGSARRRLTTTTRAAKRLNSLLHGISYLTVVSGSLVISAVVARALAWLNGSTSTGQLVGLLVIAVIAACVGRRADNANSATAIDRALSRLAFRAGLVQTVLAAVTVLARLL
jgi:hypothetical protein